MVDNIFSNSYVSMATPEKPPHTNPQVILELPGLLTKVKSSPAPRNVGVYLESYHILAPRLEGGIQL